MRATEKIWMNGELVDWADAKIHVASHGLHYGSGVFEGIRCYETEKGPAVFRLRDHLERLENSAKVLYMDLPFAREELRRATHELIAANGLPSCYIRPVAYILVVRTGKLLRPPLSMSILPGITRDTIIHLARTLGYPVEETLLIRTDLYLADEVFMVGTATEVAPVRSVDDREIGVGPVTRDLQKAYLDTVTGASERWSHWLDVV